MTLPKSDLPSLSPCRANLGDPLNGDLRLALLRWEQTAYKAVRATVFSLAPQ